MSLSGVFLGYLAAVNLLAFALFGSDKMRAQRGDRRIPERDLIGLSLIGGSLGGMLAMKAYRHKTRKPKFKYGLPLMLVLQLVFVSWLLTRFAA